MNVAMIDFSTSQYDNRAMSRPILRYLVRGISPAKCEEVCLSFSQAERHAKSVLDALPVPKREKAYVSIYDATDMPENTLLAIFAFEARVMDDLIDRRTKTQLEKAQEWGRWALVSAESEKILEFRNMYECDVRAGEPRRLSWWDRFRDATGIPR